MSNPLFGTCSSCGPNPSPGWTCTGSVQLSGTAGYHDLDFGTQSAGKYQIQYCGGAWIFNSARSDKYTVNTDILLDPGQQSFTAIHSPKQSTHRACDGTTAYLTVTGHGLTNGQQIAVYSSPGHTYDTVLTTEPDPATVTVIDADNLSYPFAGGPVEGTTSPPSIADTGITVWQILPFTQPAPTGTHEWAYTSQTLAETAFQCLGLSLYHLGGHIKLLYRDNPYGESSPGAGDENADGSPNPIFGLYSVLPEIQFNDACASWTTKGSAAQVSVSVNNFNGVTWNNVTAALLTSGGVSGAALTIPSNPFTLTPGINSLAFTFNASTALVTGTLRLTSPEWAGNIDLPWYMGPVYTAVAVADLGGSPACGGHNLHFFGMTVTNAGYWKTDPQVACSFTGSASLHFVNLTGCVDGSTQTVQCDAIDCETTYLGTNAYFVMRNANAGTATAHVTMVFTDSGYTIGTFTADVSVAN